MKKDITKIIIIIVAIALLVTGIAVIKNKTSNVQGKNNIKAEKKMTKEEQEADKFAQEAKAYNNKKKENAKGDENLTPSQAVAKAQSELPKEEDAKATLDFIGDDTFELEQYAKFGLPVLLDLGSEGCGPCRSMYGDLEQAYNEFKGKAVVKFIDVWENTRIPRVYPIDVIPTQFFFSKDLRPFEFKNPKKHRITMVRDKDGKLLYSKHVGVLKIDELRDILKEMANG